MLNRLLITAILLCSFFFHALSQENSVASQENPFIGNWNGTLGETWYDDGLRLTFHIKKTSEGFISSIASLDQNSLTPNLETIINGNTLIIRAPTIEVEYVATLTDDTLAGVWTQYGDKLELSLQKTVYIQQESSVSKKDIKEVDFIGDWSGALGKTWYDNGLRIVFQIKKTNDGFVSAIHSLDQGTFIATSETIIKNNTLVIIAPIVDGVYKATIDGDTLIGTWTQYNGITEMNLERVEK